MIVFDVWLNQVVVPSVEAAKLFRSELSSYTADICLKELRDDTFREW